MANSKESEDIVTSEHVSSFVFGVDLDVSITHESSGDEVDATEIERNIVVNILKEQIEQLQVQDVFKDDSFIHLENINEDDQIEFCVSSEIEFNNFVKAVNDGHVQKKLTDFFQSLAHSNFGNDHICLDLNLLSHTRRAAKNYFKKLSTSSDTVKVSASTENESINTKGDTDESSCESFIILPDEQQDQDSIKDDDLFSKISEHPGQFDANKIDNISVCQVSDNVPTGQPSDQSRSSKQADSSTYKTCDEITHRKDDNTDINEQNSQPDDFSTFKIKTSEDTQSNQVSASTENEPINTKGDTDESSYESFIIIPDEQQDQDSIKDDDLFPKISEHPGQFDANKIDSISVCQASDNEPTGQPSDQSRSSKQADSSTASYKTCDEITHSKDDNTDVNEQKGQATPLNVQSNQTFVASEKRHEHLKIDRLFNEDLAKAIREDFLNDINPQVLLPLLGSILNPGNKSEIETIQQQDGRNKAASRLLQILTYKDDWFDSILKALCTTNISLDHVAKKFENKRDEVLKMDQYSQVEIFQDAHENQAKMQFFVYIAPDNNDKIQNVSVTLMRDGVRVSERTLEKMTETYRNNMWTVRLDHFHNIKYQYSYEVRKTMISLMGHKSKTTKPQKSEIFTAQDSVLVFNIVKTTDSCLAEGCTAHVGIIFSKLLTETLPVCVKAVRSLELLKLTEVDSANLMIQLNKEIDENVNICSTAYILLAYLIGILSQNISHQKAWLNIPTARAESILQSFKDIQFEALDLAMRERIENVAVTLCKLAYPEHGACVLKLMDSCYPALHCTYFSQLLKEASKPFPVVDERINYKENGILFHSVCKMLSDCQNNGHAIKELYGDVFRYAPLQYSLLEIDAVHDDEFIFDIVLSNLQRKSKELAQQYDFVSLKYLWDILPSNSTHRENACHLIAKAILSSISNLNKVDVTQEHESALIDMTALFEKEDLSNLLNTVSRSKNKTVHDFFIKFLSLNGSKLIGKKYDPYIIQWFDEAAWFNNSKKTVHVHMDDLPYMYQCLDALFKSDFVSSNETLIHHLDKRAKESVLKNKLDEVFIRAFEISTFESQQVETLFKEHLQAVLTGDTSEKTVLATLANIWDKQNVLSVNFRLHVDIIIIVLDSIKLINCSSLASRFMNIMESWRFWTNIFVIKDVKIQDHSIVNSAKCVIISVAKKMISLELQCSFVRIVQKNEDASVCNMKNVTESFEKIMTSEEITNTAQFLSYWESAKSLMKKADDTFKMMHHVLQKLKEKACETIPDLDNAVNILKMKEKRYFEECVYVVDLQNRSFWGVLQDITTVVPDLEQPVSSDIFWNVCQDIIKTKLCSIQEEAELDTEQSMIQNSTSEDLETEPIQNRISEDLETEPIQNRISEDLETEPIQNSTSEDLETEPIQNSTSEDLETEPIQNRISEDLETEPIQNRTSEDLETEPIITLTVLQELKSSGTCCYKDIWKPYIDAENKTVSNINEAIKCSTNLLEEIEIAEAYLKMKLEKWVKIGLLMLHDFKKYEAKMVVLKHVLTEFGINILHDDSFSDALNLFSEFDNSTFTLKKLYSAKLSMDEVLCDIKENVIEVLKELTQHPALVKFLFEIVDEDVRNLIDAVEEHSEHRIQPSAVSSLIDLKSFIRTFCKADKMLSAKNIFKSICASTEKIGCQKLIQMINEASQNVNCLRSLFHNLANHVAITKEIVDMLTNEDMTATVHFFIDAEGTCLVKIKCKNNNTEFVYSKIDISDHRSRAFLLMNTKKETYAQNGRLKLTSDSYQTFINYIDAALEICLFLENLHQTGHPDYVDSNFNLTFLVSKLKCEAKTIEGQLNMWRDILKTSYDKYFWLCYFHPQQLWKMKQCLQKEIEKEHFLELLQFTGFQSDCFQEACELFCHGVKTKNDFGLSLLGEILDSVLENILLKPLSLPKNETCSQSNIVQYGKLCIASLENGSRQVIPTLMAMYRDTTGAFPLPHQVLFCREDTSWEEINLLLMRCLRSGTRNSRNKDLELYCIAMVENLPNAIQYFLVDEIKRHQWQSSRLALICRGQTGHPFLDYFSDYVYHISQMTTAEIKKCYEMVFPNVITITSEVPGLGKTTHIENIANTQQRKLKTIYINGDIDIRTLLSQLSGMTLQQSDSLHINVDLVNDPLDLDILIYQMIILRNMAHRSNRVHIQTQIVFIEIANTVNNYLLDSLFTTMMFKRKHLKWENFSNYIVSTTVTSSVQVVCHYLDAMNKHTLPDKDILFEGNDAVEPMFEQRCRELLQQFFTFEGTNSFTLVNIALNVLAEQLRRMSCSIFFQVAQLRSMMAFKGRSIKQDMVKGLLNVSKEFAKRSVKSCRSDQERAQSGRSVDQISAASVVERVEIGLIRWTESNHLVIAFNNQDRQTTSFVYRDLKHVSCEIQNLYESQERKKLPDLTKMSPKELHQMLELITRTKPLAVSESIKETLQNSYALTADNFLKMILISQRIDANIPVIMMGETGCGKTSVIRYLSQVCGTKMEIINFHAGIDEKRIIERVCSIIDEASRNPERSTWLFLDEINTSNHLGLISNIICHRSCYDHKLPENLVVIAACNPYKLRTSNVFTSGLKDKAKMDERSGLVYRVNPLPESILDYVWDFGTLSENDELSYIQRMVTDVVSKPKLPVLVDLLVMSHLLIRMFEDTHYCVSLRDVDRCRKLIPWFSKMLKEKQTSDEDVERNSIILSLAHTYHYRIPKAEDRKKYRNGLLNVFKKHNVWTSCNILEVISNEQKDILNRMKLPEGTAKNSALKENVFVVLVCILNKIPVFLVGKPGCSKSLSLQLIKDNLRGADSIDDFFKTLPEVYFVSYQGSEMSTSEGIIKVFEKAKSYQKKDNENVLPVVILDEVGLAENSCFNPLKVLHSLLEPEDRQVSVVGISNWALDPAKMNRVVHLSRPDLDAGELYETGKDIGVANATENHRVDDNILKILAETYQYIHKELTNLPNFHGLRDFYSLVKYVSREISLQKSGSSIKDKLQCAVKGIQRNFGGKPTGSLMNIFENCVKKTFQDLENVDIKPSPVLELIEDNINDKKARNLMLITEGDAALGVVEMLLKQMGREFVTIFGSQLDGDIADEYNYRILSKIILCMEQGIVLIMKDLERIYGSLYDMLNQNYTTVTKKHLCCVALGPHNNALCQVHEDFRCIVIIDKNKLDNSDPPFLNRFEKQTLQIADVLSPEDKKTVEELEMWTAKLSEIENMSFEQIDLIPVYSEELIPSLVYSNIKEGTKKQVEILEQCQHELINVCTPEGITRGKKSTLANNSRTEYDSLLNDYFELPVHNGLKSFLESHKNDGSGETGQNIIILTHSNIHEDVEKSLQSKCQVENLATFKSEKELSARLETFWFNRDKTILIVKSLPSVDGQNLLLLKATLEKQRSEFLKTDTMSSLEKHVLIILHLQKTVHEKYCFINFLSEWKVTLIDNLVAKDLSLINIHNKSIFDLIVKKGSLQDTIRKLMFWAFNCIGYSRSFRTLNDLSVLIERIQETNPILGSIEKVIWRWLKNNTKIHEKEMWQTDLACDKTRLLAYSTFLDAIDEVVCSYIKHPLAAVVCKIEIFNAWNRCSWCLNDQQCDEKLQAWIHHMTDEHVVDISNDPPPAGPECLYGPDTLLHLKHPFSKAFLLHIEEKVKKLFLKELSVMNENDCITESQLHSLLEKYLDPVKQSASTMFEYSYPNQQDDYFDDFCALLCSKSTILLATTQKVNMLKKVLTSLMPLSNDSFPEFVTKLHIIYWLNESKLYAVQHLVDACMQVQCNEPNEYYDEFISLIDSREHKENKLDVDITKQPVSESTDNVEEENCFEITTWCRIIEQVCRKLLQSSVHLENEEDCNTWQRNTSMVLTHADVVSVVPPVSHKLSLCNHFASMIIMSGGISEDYLVRLGRHLTEKELDSKEMFDFILQLLKELKLEPRITNECLLQFYSCYVSCCFEANIDTQVMSWVMEETLSNELLTEGDYYLFGPALHLAIAINLGLDNGPKTLVDIIQNEKSIQGTFFMKLDKALRGQKSGSSFLCLCVDIFQHFFVENEVKDEILISYLNKCSISARCLSQTVAVACAKYHLEQLSRLKSQNKLIEQLLKEEQTLNQIYRLDLYFIACAVAGDGIMTFKRLCKNFKFLEDKGQQHMSNNFDLNPLLQPKCDSTVIDAFDKFPSDETSLTSIINQSVNDHNVQFSLFSVTLHKFFLSRLLQPLSETESSIAKNICKVATEANMPKDALNLLHCLCCLKDFKFSVLSNICEETGEKEFQIASFLIHVICSCLTNDQQSKPSAWYMCMIHTAETAKFYLPGVTKTDEVSVGFCTLIKDEKQVQFSESSSNPKSVFVNNCLEENVGTMCSKKTKGDKMKKKHISLFQEETPMNKGYIPCDPNNDIITTTRSLSPVAFRFIQLLIHACFVGSLALGLSTKQELAEHLTLQQDLDVEDYLRKHMFTHWEVLKQLTTCGHAQLGKFLHELLNKMDSHLFKTADTLETPRGRTFIEDSICNLIDGITKTRFSAIQDTTKRFLSVSSTLPLNLDSILQEVNIDEDKFPLFLKQTLPPSFLNMKSEFIINKMDKQFPFLALVIAKENQLSLLECLLPIVKWHSFCFEKISYKKTRDECRRLLIMDFIKRCDEKEHSEKLFQDFRDAWNKLISNENFLRKYNKNLGKVPKITMDNMVEDCIIIDSNCAIYQILVALKNVQNEFLEDALIISLTLKSPCLTFMKKTDKSAVLAIIPIEEITEKDIVHLNMDLSQKRLSDTILKFSQCCKEYGHGRIHNYDFYFIERQFADYILVKKPCLEITASFPMVVFFGDCLYRSVAQFEDVEAFVKQCEIKTDIKKKVSQLMHQSHSYLRIILEYLEIIFTLMKRTQQPKHERDLAQYYITQWPVYFHQKSREVEVLLRPIELCYLTSLFEYVESLEGDKAICNLEGKFTTPLNDVLEANLKELVNTADVNLLERLLAALKRFAYRNIEDCGVSAEDQLCRRILHNPALWPRDPQRLFPDKPKQLDIHPDLCVKHIKSAVQYLHQHIEKKRGRFEPDITDVKSKRPRNRWHKKII